MDISSWEKLAGGRDCPFDAPRAPSTPQWEHVSRLEVSSLYLARNQTYRGQCLVILDLRHATRPDQLTPAEWTAYCADLHRAQVAVQRAVQPDHVNIAALGNVIPHLHWHIVPRYRTDPRWGHPIWPEELQHRLSAADEGALIAALRAALAP